jgi:trehalose/maltose hydrolase-like predicted phosphorylase
VLGFAGVRVTNPDDDVLVLDPHIPGQWDELRIKLQWHGTTVSLRCLNDAVHVACSTDLRVRLSSDAPVLITAPGGWVARSVPGPRTDNEEQKLVH